MIDPQPFIRLARRPPKDWQSAYDQWYYDNFGIIDGWRKELAAADCRMFGNGKSVGTVTDEKFHSVMFPEKKTKNKVDEVADEVADDFAKVSISK